MTSILSSETHRRPTAEEQTVLARYVGWGGIPQAFPRPDGTIAKGWEKEVKELRFQVENPVQGGADRNEMMKRAQRMERTLRDQKPPELSGEERDAYANE